MSPDKNEVTPQEAAKLLEASMRESYFKSLEMIVAFSFGDMKAVEDAQPYPNKELLVGALLSHCRYIFEYMGDLQGLEPSEVCQGYSYHFYGNVLPDMEAMFKSVDVDQLQGKIREIDERYGDDNDDKAS